MLVLVLPTLGMVYNNSGRLDEGQARTTIHQPTVVYVVLLYLVVGEGRLTWRAFPAGTQACQ